MRKRILALALLALFLTGCAGTAPTNTTQQPQSPANTFPGLGGVMPNMTFETADEEILTLYGLLEEKELVILNFWFESCGWCMREFTAMELAYQDYRQDVEIVALNPSDGAAAVKAFQQKRGLSFPLAACRNSTAREAGVTAYPTSIFIDRDGVVCLIHVGAITAPDDLRTLFAAFTGEDYTRQIYGSIQEILN